MSPDTLHIDLEKRLGDFTLRVSQSLPLEGVTAIFGESGSGKSTLLRLIAGLDRPDRGTLTAKGETWVSSDTRSFTPADKRRVGYVFQSGHLLPHLSVLGNLRYADRRARGTEAGYGFEDVVSAFDLDGLTARRPATLSGGERQRVALAQALLTRPRLLLLDEPLSALDQRRKAAILPYLDQLQARFSLPILYVSHDMREVLRIADRVLAMDKGRIRAFGSTVEVLNTQGFQTDGAARSGTILTGRVTHIDTRLRLAEIAIGTDTIKLPLQETTTTGAEVKVIVNANEVALSTQQPSGLSIQNVLAGTIFAIRHDTNTALADVTVMLGKTALPVRITRASAETLSLREGMPIYALIKTALLAK